MFKQVKKVAYSTTGPLLFIAAIIIILAIAIAAGNGSLSGKASESDADKATALIQVGRSLQGGWNRLMNSEIGFDEVVVGIDSIANETDLFSPTGGGVLIPSTSMAMDPVNDSWYYPKADVLGVGLSGPEHIKQLAMLRVTRGVCEEVNRQANGVTASPEKTDVGNPVADAILAGAATNWPAALYGKPIGCIENMNDGPGAAGYWFYDIIGMR